MRLPAEVKKCPTAWTGLPDSSKEENRVLSSVQTGKPSALELASFRSKRERCGTAALIKLATPRPRLAQGVYHWPPRPKELSQSRSLIQRRHLPDGRIVPAKDKSDILNARFSCGIRPAKDAILIADCLEVSCTPKRGSRLDVPVVETGGIASQHLLRRIQGPETKCRKGKPALHNRKCPNQAELLHPSSLW